MKPSAVRWRVRPCVAMCSVKRCGRRLPTGARSQAPDPGRKKMRRGLVGTAASDTPYGCCFAVGVQSQGAGACQASPRRRHLNIRTKDARGQGMPLQRAACCQSFVWFPWALRPAARHLLLCLVSMGDLRHMRGDGSNRQLVISGPPYPRPAAPTRSACHLRPPGLRRQLAEGTYAATLPNSNFRL